MFGWVYKLQLENEWPGLVKESREICKALDIEDITETNHNKKDYMKIVDLALKV